MYLAKALIVNDKKVTERIAGELKGGAFLLTIPLPYAIFTPIRANPLTL